MRTTSIAASVLASATALITARLMAKPRPGYLPSTHQIGLAVTDDGKAAAADLWISNRDCIV